MRTQLSPSRGRSLAAPAFVAALLAVNIVSAQNPADAPPRDDRPPADREGSRPARPPEGEVRRDGQRGERPQPPEGFRGGQGQARFGGDFLTGLNEEQRDAFRQMSEYLREEGMKIGEQMRDARRELQEAIYAEKVDPKVIKNKAAAVGKLDGEMAVLRAEAFAKLRPKLTEEQVERIKQMPPEFVMRGAMGGPGGPGGPGFRPDGVRPPGQGDQPGRPRPDGQNLDRPQQRRPGAPGDGQGQPPEGARRPPSDADQK